MAHTGEEKETERQRAISYASSAAFPLYDGGLLGEHPGLREVIRNKSVQLAEQISPISTIFSSELIRREAEPVFESGDQGWNSINLTEYSRGHNQTLPPCVLSLLKQVTIQNAAIYFDGDIDTTMLYEMQRPPDRPTTVGDVDVHMRQRIRLDATAHDRAYLFLSSAGSHNWGHWLTDDLPRTAAAAFLRHHLPQRTVTILLISFGAGIDEARRRSIERHRELAGVEVRFIERYVTYQFDQLYFASPVTYHPSFKLRAAMRYVRDTYVPADAKAGRKLYVTRPAGNMRHIINSEEVEAFMQKAGYDLVDPGNMTFDQQVESFSSASSVVGIMGAAMTNAIFSQPGTRVVQLACEGWIEPYYWDLADACGHRWAYVFGPTADPGNPPHFARFSISIDTLSRTLEA